MPALPCSVPHLRCRIPARPASTITRTRLIDALEHRSPAPNSVTLVTAAAGSGKTTLLVDWVTEMSLRGAAPVAWLTIDESDNSLASFRMRVSTALSQCGSASVAAAVTGLPRPGEPGYERYGALLIDALESTAEPLWIVLDDAHLLHDREALTALGNFLHWPPHNVRIVIAGRFEPPLALQKLRLDGRVHDISTADVAFTDAEAAAMFADAGITLNDKDFDAVITRTQGWAAGLRLAAMALTDCEDPGAVIERFSGSQHAVADYLVSEVLAGLPAEVRRFLVETSVPEWFTVDLAEHLTGGALTQETIDLLLDKNFLIEQSPGPDLKYRYHPLLRSYLRAEMYRLGVAQVRDLESVASQWFSESGQPLQALEHGVHSRDARSIGDTLMTSGLGLVMEGHSREVLEALELGSRSTCDSIYGRLLCAAAHLAEGNIAPAASVLSALSQSISTLTSDSTPHQYADAQILQRSLEVQAAVQIGAIGPALQRLELLGVGRTGNATLDAFSLTTAGTAHLYIGNITEAQRLLFEAVEHARAGGMHRFALAAMTSIAASDLLAGQLDDALLHSRAALDHAHIHSLQGTMAATAAGSLGALVAYLRMDAVPCPPGLWSSIGAATDPIVADFGRRTACALEVRTDSRGVPRVGREWLEYDRPVVRGLEALLAPIVMQKYNSAGEALWAAELIRVTTRRLGPTGEVSLLTADMHRRAGRVDAAESELALVTDGRRPCASPITVLRALLAAAAIAHIRNNPAKAYELTTKALTLAEPENVLLPFVETGADVREILTLNHGRFGYLESFAEVARMAIPRHDPPGYVGPLSTLTPRELELLRQLPSWRTAEQIASDHFVSVNTIKTHLRGIYRKLEVRSRRDAIAAGYDLGLL